MLDMSCCIGIEIERKMGQYRLVNDPKAVARVERARIVVRKLGGLV